jgi:pyruvate dehydrogenase E1 component beta subunit
MPRKSYAQAIADTLYDTLKRDPSVTIVGSYVLGFGPFNPLLNKVRQDFPDRLWDPPTSEAVNAYLGIGAAMAGARPMIDFATAAFSYLAWSPLVNEAGIAHYMTGGAVNVPVVFHMLHGIRGGGGPQHSHSPQAMLWNAAGLQIVLPSTPRDVTGLLRSAFRTRNPVVMIDHYRLMGTEGEVPDEDYEIPFGVADVKRGGRDVTLVATSHMVLIALEAAKTLADDDIDVEVLDPRTLVPFDTAALLDSVGRTGRLVILDECNLRCGVAAEIAATVAEAGFHSLKAPIVRVTRPDVPVPFSPPLEQALTPNAGDVVAAVRKLMAAPVRAA